MWVPLQSVSRHNFPDIFERRRQQNDAAIVVIGHEDKLVLVDGQVPWYVQLLSERGSGRTADRLDDTSVHVEPTDAVNWILESAVADDELTTGQLDRVPRVDHFISQRDGANWIAMRGELFDGADVVAGNKDVMRGRGYRHTTWTVADRPLRHGSLVHIHSMDAVVDVIRHIQTPVVPARRHVGKSFKIWNRQPSEKTVALSVENLDLFCVLPS